MLPANPFILNSFEIFATDDYLCASKRITRGCVYCRVAWRLNSCCITCVIG